MSNEIPSKYTSFQESISMFDEESRYRPPTDSEPSIYYISSDKPGLRWDGAPIRIITEITAHTREHPSSQYLDEPLFKYDQGDIYPSDNRLINSEDCNPVFLVNLVDRLADRDMPYPEEIRQDVIEGVRGVFLEGATPRMFYNNVSDHANLIFKDDVHPETYRATPELFFGSMANKNILAFDIHDLLHHPLQLATWPEQFQYVSKAAYIAQTLPKDFTYRERLQKLTELTWLATFEESLITTNDQLVSFGCLNWLAPSETPFNITAPTGETIECSLPAVKLAEKLVNPCSGFYAPHLSCLNFGNSYRGLALHFWAVVGLSQVIECVNKCGGLLFYQCHSVIVAWIESQANCFLAKSEFALYFVRHMFPFFITDKEHSIVSPVGTVMARAYGASSKRRIVTFTSHDRTYYPS